jgi:hypothetical protein
MVRAGVKTQKKIKSNKAGSKMIKSIKVKSNKAG